MTTRHRPALRWLLCAWACALASAASATTLAEIEQQHRRGDTAGALRQVDAALAATPGDAPLRFMRAVMLAETGRSAEATEAYERMTQDFPELPEPYNNLAVVKAAAGRLDEARALLETALQQDPGYRTARENLGDVLLRLAARAYEAAADGARSEPALLNKLRQVRELIGLNR